MEKLANTVGVLVLGLITAVVLGLLFSLPVMWLWNGSLVPAVTGLNTIGWVQSWGISILCNCLFKSYKSA